MVKTKRKMIKGSTLINPDANNEAHKYFNLQRIISITRINSDKMYNNMKGSYNSLTSDERKQIATCLMGPVKSLFERLGMAVSFSKLPDNGGQ